MAIKAKFIGEGKQELGIIQTYRKIDPALTWGQFIEDNPAPNEEKVLAWGKDGTKVTVTANGHLFKLVRGISDNYRDIVINDKIEYVTYSLICITEEAHDNRDHRLPSVAEIGKEGTKIQYCSKCGVQRGQSQKLLVNSGDAKNLITLKNRGIGDNPNTYEIISQYVLNEGVSLLTWQLTEEYIDIKFPEAIPSDKPQYYFGGWDPANEAKPDWAWDWTAPYRTCYIHNDTNVPLVLGNEQDLVEHYSNSPGGIDYKEGFLGQERIFNATWGYRLCFYWSNDTSESNSMLYENEPSHKNRFFLGYVAKEGATYTFQSYTWCYTSGNKADKCVPLGKKMRYKVQDLESDSTESKYYYPGDTLIVDKNYRIQIEWYDNSDVIVVNYYRNPKNVSANEIVYSETRSVGISLKLKTYSQAGAAIIENDPYWTDWWGYEFPTENANETIILENSSNNGSDEIYLYPIQKVAITFKDEED